MSEPSEKDVFDKMQRDLNGMIGKSIDYPSCSPADKFFNWGGSLSSASAEKGGIKPVKNGSNWQHFSSSVTVIGVGATGVDVSLAGIDIAVTGLFVLAEALNLDFAGADLDSYLSTRSAEKTEVYDYIKSLFSKTKDDVNDLSKKEDDKNNINKIGSEIVG